MRCSVNGVSVEGPLGEEEVADVWPKAEPMLSAALETDGVLTTNDLFAQMSDGLWGLYIVKDDETGEVLGAVCCEVQQWPLGDVFNIAHCGGHSLHRWAGLLGALESEAVRLGCETVRIEGRKGWGAIYPDYREVKRVFERRVVVTK
jgi:hypothetical protein